MRRLGSSKSSAVLELACAFLSCAQLLACESGAQSSGGPRPLPVLSDEPSPNASILPEPLGENKGRSSSADPNSQLNQPTTPVVLPRPIPVPLPLGETLTEDTLPPGGTAGGYHASARFVWPAAQSSVVHEGEKTLTWPHFEIDLLREVPDQPARLRVVLSSPVFPLAQGTELRMRADRIGSLIVWPDQRSYRSISPGTLSALFADRRADRLPFVEATAKLLEETMKAGRPVVRRQIETSLGTAEMQLVHLDDLPYAAPLLCQLLLDMVRVAGSNELCPEHELPIRLLMKWKNGGGFLFEVLGYNQEPRLNLDALRMPPALPIFKRGELPPSNDYFLPEGLRNELFALKRPGEPHLPRPTKPLLSESTSAGAEYQAPSSETLLAPDEIELKNTTDVPLIVQLDRLPFVWLPPGETRSLRVQGAPVFYAARDFWGHYQLEPGLVNAPAHVTLGRGAPFERLAP